MNRKILFDTTYLLPLLGIKVKRLGDYSKYIESILNTYKVYYHPVSLVESKWELISLRRGMDSEEWIRAAHRYKAGLNYILKSGKLTQLKFTTTEVEDEIDYLIMKGYRDYFDLLIFTTAYIENITLLTEDNELRDIPNKFKKYENMGVMDWNELIKTIQ